MVNRSSTPYVDGSIGMTETRLRFKRSAKLPMILQEEYAECGHACMAMIARYWGHQIDMHVIRKYNQPSTRGVTLKDLHELSMQLKLDSRALRVPMSELHLVKYPAILHWDMNHFVVLKSMKKKVAIIHDPAVGIKSITHEELSQSYTGIVLEIQPSQNFDFIRDVKTLRLTDLIKLMKGTGRFFAWVFTLSSIIELLGLANPMYIQYVTDEVLASSNNCNLLIMTGLFIVTMGLHAVTTFIRGNMLIYLTYHLTEKFSTAVVYHLLSLPLSFFERRHKGDIQSKLQSVEQIQKKLGADFISTVLDGLMAIINFSVLLFYNVILASCVLGFLCISIAIRYAEYCGTKKKLESSVICHASAMTHFLETLQSMMTIKLFSREALRVRSWRNIYVNALNADIQVSQQHVLYQFIQYLLNNTEYILLISLGAQFVLNKKMSLGMLMAFLGYRLLFSQKSVSFMQSILDYKLIGVQLSRVSDIVFQEPERVARIAGTEVKGIITLNNIGFQYSTCTPFIFKNIHLEIRQHEKLVITGKSGCGKTTLLKIMMGLLQPNEGSVLIDNIPLQTIGHLNYRDSIASVMQDDVLLTGTIAENITFFDEASDIEEVKQAAKLAEIHDTIKAFPMGYHTCIGDMGIALSGGQKQRLLIARALYKKPKLLFMDEATSHLDVECERKINQSLKALSITQVVVAHREETIKMADRKFILKTV